ASGSRRTIRIAPSTSCRSCGKCAVGRTMIRASAPGCAAPARSRSCSAPGSRSPAAGWASGRGGSSPRRRASSGRRGSSAQDRSSRSTCSFAGQDSCSNQGKAYSSAVSRASAESCLPGATDAEVSAASCSSLGTVRTRDRARPVKVEVMPQVRAAARPTTLGHYTLIERIGTGGQAEVWRAHDESRGVDIALKVLAPSVARNPAAWEALEREHAISSRLQHPGILQVLSPERVDDIVVLPMELAGGGDLCRLRGAGYLEIVPILLEVAEALEYAHARGVVHRDLKPGNVLFDSRGRVKVADFGIAALLPAAGAGAAEPHGAGHSPFSASPEQLRGEPPSAADDIYGLGALAYELLSGHPPYYPNFELRRVLTQPVPE